MNFTLHSPQGLISEIPYPTAITVGVFDGVHRGHRDMLQQLKTMAKGLPTVVISLSSHPSFVLGKRAQENWLDTEAEHLRLLFDAGIDYVATLPFTADVANITALDMAKEMVDMLNMKVLFLGYDSRFGNRQHDNFDQLDQLGTTLGFSVYHGTPYLYKDKAVSSSRIRQALIEGNLEEVHDLLGRPYCLYGTVIKGRGVGRQIGFPTANIDLVSNRKMLPLEGVYAVLLDGKPAMANLGAIPTYGILQPSLEVHIVDYNSDLYGQSVQVEFLHRVRDIIAFESEDALRLQLKKDLISVRQWLSH